MDRLKQLLFRAAISIVNLIYILVRPFFSAIMALHMVIYTEVSIIVNDLCCKNSRTKRLLRGDNWFWKM